MAPKSMQTKRPAASSKRVAVVTKARRPIKKIAKGKARLTAKKCRHVIDKLGVQAIPDSLREDLAKQKCVLLGKRAQKLRVSEDEAAMILKEAAGHVKEALQASLQEAHAKIKDVDFDKRERDSAKNEAEETLVKVRQAVVDHRLAIKNATKVIETKRQAITMAKSSQKQASAAMKLAQAKKQRLESVEQNSFGPLKETVAEGTDGQKHLSSLRRAGKEFGFHEEMMKVLPSVLKKEFDKRQTFDGLVVDRLGVEFVKHSGALDTQLKECENVAVEWSSALEQAQSDVQTAKEEQKTHVQALAEAEKALADVKEELMQAKRRVRAFPLDLRKAVRNMESAKTRIEKFRNDPAIRALDEIAPSPLMSAERPSDEQLL